MSAWQKSIDYSRRYYELAEFDTLSQLCTVWNHGNMKNVF